MLIVCRTCVQSCAAERPRSNLSAGDIRSTAPVTFTTQEDHQQMLRQLGIARLRPGPSGNPDAPNAANNEEAKANPYPEWPEVLKLENGTPVTTADAWWKQRRGERFRDAYLPTGMPDRRIRHCFRRTTIALWKFPQANQDRDC